MTAFVICSRLSSARVPGKPTLKYSGKTHLELLITRLLKTNINVFLAVPENEVIQYSYLLDIFPKRLTLYSGNEDDPLARQYNCAVKHKINNVIRITHDKIFVDIEKIPSMLEEYLVNKLDYVFSSDFTPGTGFEIISQNALRMAHDSFKRVEHVSYAIKAVTKNYLNYRFNNYKKDVRLLVDYKEDTSLMQVIFATLGTDCTLKEVLKLIDENKYLKDINHMPLVTVYTCALDAEKWIQEAMGSVATQSDFKNYEYILIDDFSSDRTLLHMAKFAHTYKNTKFLRNDKNLGLASSCNIALKHARGKYIIRLDADDFFINKHVIQNMIKEIESENFDVVYPNCYAGLSMKTIQKGSENNHAGGALFNTSAINHIKFTDNLRNHDSLDIFLRAKDQLKIGYYNRVAFCYRQHNSSMSKTNIIEREKTRSILENQYG